MEKQIDRGESGFTLMELLVVIAIMGLLLSISIPAAGAFDDHARKKLTHEEFTAIRLAILGAKNSYDQYGKPVLGGYVGEVGYLPKIYNRMWDASNSKWVLEKDVAGDYVSTINSAPSCGPQPVALWNRTVGSKESGWKRVHLSAPVDPMPEDQFMEYSASLSGVDEYAFYLREANGCLTDGWGRALIVYSDNILANDYPQNLIFVSAGPDGDFSTTPSDAVNDDNLELRINEADWNFNDVKISTTRSLLSDIREAIIGTENKMVNGAIEPYGYIADNGFPEILVGSYVSHSEKVYRAKKHLTSSTSFTSSNWEEKWDNATNPDVTLRFNAWKPHTNYYVSTPENLFYNSPIVYHDNAIYSCIDTDGSNASPSSTAGEQDWSMNNDITAIDTVKYLWKSGSYYPNNNISNSILHSSSNLQKGWRSSYLLTDKKYPLSDAWGIPITISLNHNRDIVIRSRGFDISNASDDLTNTISKNEYETSVTVEVIDAITTDFVLFYPFNGTVVSKNESPPSTVIPRTIVFDNVPVGRVIVQFSDGTLPVFNKNVRIYSDVTNIIEIPAP